MLGTAGTRDTRSLQTFHCADSIQDFFKLSYAWFMRMHYWQKKKQFVNVGKGSLAQRDKNTNSDVCQGRYDSTQETN